MFADLQTDPDFPAFAESADLTALQAMESMMRQNEVADFLMQWTPTEITDVSGQRYMVLARPIGEGDAPDGGAWQLVPAQNGNTLRAGKIYLDYGDWENPLPIIDAELSLPSSGTGWVWLEFDIADPANPTLTLKYGTTWPGYPSAFTESGGSNPVRRAIFPVWKFNGDDPREKFLFAPHSIIVWGVRRFTTPDNRNDRTFAPVLFPLA